MDKVYYSSRLTKGNFWFPDRVTVAPDGVHFLKRRIFGSDEEIINYDQIASVKINSGVLWANITIETAGGSQPVFINGLPKGGAQEIKEAIRHYQQY
ncbi:MAG: PH domain-containing protein [Chloroflexi bacterium]|nr:PH domain-containing protein [Chloroflexota bacterium]